MATSKDGATGAMIPEIPNDTLDFLCGHHRVYIVDDGLVSGIMKLRCQDCPREFSKDVGSAQRRSR